MPDRDGAYRVFRLAAVYDAAQAAIRSQRSRRRFFDRFVRAKPGAAVLDLGCGTGDALAFLPDVRYWGVDSNEAYLRAAQRRFGARGTFLVADLASLGDVPDGAFDVVLALGVLHHLDDEQCRHVFAAAGRVMTPAGRFVSHDPVLTACQSAAARWVVRRDRGRHVRTAEHIVGLAGESFGEVRHEIIPRPLRIPYTEIALECMAGRAPGPAPEDGLSLTLCSG